MVSGFLAISIDGVDMEIGRSSCPVSGCRNSDKLWDVVRGNERTSNFHIGDVRTNGFLVHRAFLKQIFPKSQTNIRIEEGGQSATPLTLWPRIAFESTGSERSDSMTMVEICGPWFSSTIFCTDVVSNLDTAGSEAAIVFGIPSPLVRQKLLLYWIQ